jgi:hypothetical protein
MSNADGGGGQGESGLEIERHAGGSPLSDARSKPVLETIILATCLITSPLNCKDIEIQVAPEHGASLQLPYYCARQGQIEIQKWIAEHPAWRVEKWSCPPKTRVGHKI